MMTLCLAACMPFIPPPHANTGLPLLRETYFQTADGSVLPVRRWLPQGETKAVLVTLHGFNDYSHFFEQPGQFLSGQGIACWAYDQRGFGLSPRRGVWAGVSAYGEDLRAFVRLVKQRYPHQPVYVLGESMGGAVTISALAKAPMPEVAGVVLVAPALWARSTMPWYQTSALWALVNTWPSLRLTGRGLHIKPSDNIPMLRALGKDPLVIKATRVDAIAGLSDLMDEAFANAKNLSADTLLLYGEKDELIPKEPTYRFLRDFLADDTGVKTAAVYENGYHMLLRDLQAPLVWQDIAAWIANAAKPLPSKADQQAQAVLARFNATK
ncbi:alpha/beta hydrolase [Methylosoma difficile]